MSIVVGIPFDIAPVDYTENKTQGKTCKPKTGFSMFSLTL